MNGFPGSVGLMGSVSVEGSLDALVDQFREVHIPAPFISDAVRIIRAAKKIGISALEASLKFLGDLQGYFVDYERAPTQEFADEINGKLQGYLNDLSGLAKKLKATRAYGRRTPTALYRRTTDTTNPLTVERASHPYASQRSGSLDYVEKRPLLEDGVDVHISASASSIYEHVDLTDIMHNFPFAFSGDRPEVVVVLEFPKKKRWRDRGDTVCNFSLYPFEGRIGIKNHGRAALREKKERSATFVFSSEDGRRYGAYGIYNCTIYFTNPNNSR